MNIIERARALRTIIEQAAQSLDDATALQAKELYPHWSAGTAYTVGHKLQHGGKLWRCLQAHTALEGWEPANAPALFEQIDETHAGTADDPIPYSGNMELMVGMYYAQDGETYLCTRDTGAPVYHALKDLIGTYVEKA